MIKFPKRYMDRCKYQRLDFDAPIKSDKWRNLYFNKDGTCLFGHKLHESEYAALNCFRDFLIAVKVLGVYYNITNGVKRNFKFEEFSHCIQIPVKS